MPKKVKFRVSMTKPGAPVVEVDTVAQALYVYFQRGVKVAKTVVQNQWPLVAVDLDKDGWCHWRGGLRSERVHPVTRVDQGRGRGARTTGEFSPLRANTGAGRNGSVVDLTADCADGHRQEAYGRYRTASIAQT